MLKIETSQFSEAAGRRVLPGSDDVASPQLVLYFAARELLQTPHYVELLKDAYPGASLVGCSSAGEILDTGVHDDTAVAAAIGFDTTRVRSAVRDNHDASRSYDTGLALGAELGAPDLSALIALGDGMSVNASELLRGLYRGVGREVPLIGGLAGDGDRFSKTLVGCDGAAREGRVAVVGLYGDDLMVAAGCSVGCDLFGPLRRITHSHANVLYEIDGRPVLDLYVRYLGDEAANLPASAQFLPLYVQPPGQSAQGFIRTPVSVDDKTGSLVYAGDIPEGFDARLARTSVESLVRGATEAAAVAGESAPAGRSLALLVSCIGRKMVLGRETGAELAAVAAGQGDDVARIGFYAYGEFGPHGRSGEYRLHNQSMSVTLIGER